MKNPEHIPLVVLDVDETGLNSLPRHVERLNKFFREKGWGNLPTLEEVITLGGTHNAYGHYPDYWELNRQMRHSEDFNRGLEIVRGALEAINKFRAQVAFYLTTRPATLTKVTHQELVKVEFPDRPVVARPQGVPLEDTSSWKLQVLTDFAQKKGRPVVMIDDSPSLHQTINDANNPLVQSILYAGIMTQDDRAMTWDEIVQKIMLPQV